MSRRGPRAVEIMVSAADRRALEQMRAGGVRRFAERAAIVLACADGSANTAVAQKVSASVATVRKWRARFAELGMAGSEDDVRIGRPKPEVVLTADERRQLVQWARRAKTAQYLAMRAKIILACAEGVSNLQV